MTAVDAATDLVLRAESDRIGFGLEDFRSAARAWFEQLSKELDDAGDLYQDSSLWRWAGWVREVGAALVPHLDAVHTEHPDG